jgi:hypothetical protein
MKVVRSSLALFTPRNILVLIFRGWVDPRAHRTVWCHGKNTQWLGIDPGTLRLVAQCLNHYATPGPNISPVRTHKHWWNLMTVKSSCSLSDPPIVLINCSCHSHISCVPKNPPPHAPTYGPLARDWYPDKFKSGNEGYRNKHYMNSYM